MALNDKEMLATLAPEYRAYAEWLPDEGEAYARKLAAGLHYAFMSAR